jgi:hypothetical protein
VKTAEVPEDEARVLNLIRKSMGKWESMNQAGRLAGRGLGRAELIDRVAREVGTSANQVQSALKGFHGGRT